MEGSASAPTHPQIELEPPEWQPRALWVSVRLLCGGAAFFFISFVFAYFYLRSLDSSGDWKIGKVSPSMGFGVAIVVVLIISAVTMHFAARRPPVTLPLGLLTLGLGLVAVVLQVVEWTTLGFGPASGGYASVYVGWTAFYSVFLLFCVYWIETQIASVWRRRREGVEHTPAQVLTDTVLYREGLHACSFFWTFYVLNGVLLFVILYLV
jgi:heme/copper-type cytochrome/quinol oxidase subunit 3